MEIKGLPTTNGIHCLGGGGAVGVGGGVGVESDFCTEGGGVEAAKAFDGTHTETEVGTGKPKAFNDAHGFVFGDEVQGFFFVYFVFSGDGNDFCIATFAEEFAFFGVVGIGNECKDAFSFVFFAFFIPGHGAIPTDEGSADGLGGVCLVHLADFDDSGVVGGEDGDGYFGASGFSPSEGEVVGGALRSPGACAFTEKF